jgi:hypothetical protein
MRSSVDLHKKESYSNTAMFWAWDIRFKKHRRHTVCTKLYYFRASGYPLLPPPNRIPAGNCE